MRTINHGFSRKQAEGFANRRMRWILLLGMLVLPREKTLATEYEVGPDQHYAEINDVPWESLAPGDRVDIHARETPYHSKWVICRRGTKSAPITIHGIPGPDGKLPVIDGNGATIRAALNYWGTERSVIKVGGANKPADTTPAYITIENLDICNGRPPYTYTGRGGKYGGNAAAIFIEKGEHITIRGCTLHDCGNGLAVSHASREILVEGCSIHDNGIEGSGFMHNVYTEASGMVMQYNHLGHLRAGAGGNNIKDRSSGCVIRYNWIEGGNRELDLVDAEDDAAIRTDPRYRETFVYGNIIIEPPNDGNNQIVHYGGDSGRYDWYRKGTLYFYHNTVISQRTDATALFSLSTDDEHVDCRNNIFYVTAPGKHLAMLNVSGQLDLDHNWLKPGWVKSKESNFSGSVEEKGPSLTGDAPGFVGESAEDYHLTAGSPCLHAAGALPDDVPAEYRVTREYVAPQSSREVKTPASDLGAFQSDH